MMSGNVNLRAKNNAENNQVYFIVMKGSFLSKKLRSYVPNTGSSKYTKQKMIEYQSEVNKLTVKMRNLSFTN